MPSNPIENRYDIVLLFDCRYGNPNGDPDADNAPRTNPYTGIGLVSDVCIKRKIRNWITERYGGDTTPENKNQIYFRKGCVLSDAHVAAINALAPDAKTLKAKLEASSIDARQAWMLEHFWDLRSFGAILGVGKAADEDPANTSPKKGNGKKKTIDVPAGRTLTGPVSVNISESIDPVTTLPLTITRTSQTNAGDDRTTTTNEDGENESKHGIFGRRQIVDYALYRTHLTVSAPLAAKTGFTHGDLTILLDALENLFTLDKTTSRPDMNVQGIYVFKHESKYGNASPAAIQSKVLVQRLAGVEKATKFEDYEVTLLASQIPEGVQLIHQVAGFRRL